MKMDTQDLSLQFDNNDLLLRMIQLSYSNNDIKILYSKKIVTLLSITWLTDYSTGNK